MFKKIFPHLFCLFNKTLFLCCMQTLNYEKFSKAIKKKRIIDMNVGVREIAAVTNISIATLSRCENGYMPDLITYATLCKWLNVSLDTFIIKLKKGTY